jgi:hypothetical protein
VGVVSLETIELASVGPLVVAAAGEISALLGAGSS